MCVFWWKTADLLCLNKVSAALDEWHSETGIKRHYSYENSKVSFVCFIDTFIQWCVGFCLAYFNWYNAINSDGLAWFWNIIILVVLSTRARRGGRMTIMYYIVFDLLHDYICERPL